MPAIAKPRSTGCLNGWSAQLTELRYPSSGWLEQGSGGAREALTDPGEASFPEDRDQKYVPQEFLHTPQRQMRAWRCRRRRGESEAVGDSLVDQQSENEIRREP